MKQSTLSTPQVSRNSTLAKPVAGLRQISQTPPAQLLGNNLRTLVLFLLIFVFSALAVAGPRKVAERVGRGCSAPLWGFEGRLLAYTTIDLDELYVVEPGEVFKLQTLYRVAGAEGIGRRFIFDPNNENLIYRRQANALQTKPDRLVTTPFNSSGNKMLTSNMESILGPYRIANTVYYRNSLADPLTDLEGNSRPDGAYLEKGRLTVKDRSGDEVFRTADAVNVQGFDRSPDGEWVAFVAEISGAQEIGIVEVAGGKYVSLGKGRWPSWSGDSNRLVYVVDKPEVRYSEIIVYDLNSAQSRSVQGLNQFWPDEPALDHTGSRVAFVHDGEIYVTEVTGF